MCSNKKHKFRLLPLFAALPPRADLGNHCVTVTADKEQ